MKDYYKTLGIAEDASDDDIRKAFRKLAFQYHPDKNPGHEKEAEEKFKDINEAFGVLSDKNKRKQYDLTRKGVFAGTGYGSPFQGFRYSQQDIFRDAFSNQTNLDELNRMFAQMGLRFDQDFLNRVFFGGGNSRPAGAFEDETNSFFNQTQVTQPAHKPNFFEKMLVKATKKLIYFAFRALGVQYQEPLTSLHKYRDLKLSREEAQAGGEKQFSYKINGRVKKLAVKIPPGIKPATQIRLKSMGRKSGQLSGDLFLRVKIVG